MKKLNLNFIDTSLYIGINKDLIEKTEFEDSPTDPLQEAENETGIPKYYRIDDVVFAEPINIERNKIFKENINEAISVIDNVTIKKRSCIDTDSANLKCLQLNCKSKFTLLTLYKAHIRKVHCMDKNKFICEQCGVGFKAFYLLKRHTAVHDQRKIKCAVCNKMLSERTNLRAHIRTHTDARAHECPVCHKRFARASTLATHVRFLHTDREKALKCDRCDISFESRSQLSRHTSSHSCRKTKMPQEK